MSTPGKLDIVAICGSLRQGSFNRMTLHAAREVMPDSMAMEVVEIGDLPIYNFDVQQAGFPQDAVRLCARIKAADGVLIATPEYNGGMPAALKNVIDWMSRYRPTPFHNKPCAVLSASAGQLGGGRVQYEFRRSMAFLNGHVMIQPEVFIAAAQTKFDPAGGFTDEVGRGFLKQHMAAFEIWVTRINLAFGATR